MNFALPESTTFNRPVAKQKFYENLAVSAALKRSFVDGIKTIWWRNKLAATTLNLAKGAAVTEIEVFEIELKNGELDEEVLRQMDRRIPYHLLFVLSFEGRAQARIGYKEASASGGAAFKVNRYYRTDWMPREALRFAVEGLTLDEVYENLVRHVFAFASSASDGRDGLRAVRTWRDGLSLSENVAHDVAREKAERLLAALERRAWAEKQPKRKFELLQQIKRIHAVGFNLANNLGGHYDGN